MNVSQFLQMAFDHYVYKRPKAGTGMSLVVRLDVDEKNEAWITALTPTGNQGVKELRCRKAFGAADLAPGGLVNNIFQEMRRRNG